MGQVMNIDFQCGNAFSRVFSSSVIDSIIRHGHSKYLNEVLRESQLMPHVNSTWTVEQFFKWLHDCFVKSYRNEYVYKNAIANKVLLGRHSLNTAHMLTEFRSANCKADAVVLNGTSTVYEIKSEYDSLDRLSVQIPAYSKIFDLIYVVTSSVDYIESAKQKLPARIGLMLLTPQYTFREVRKAQSGKHNTRPEKIFDSLRKNEYLSIIERVFGYIPSVPNTQIYRTCKELFCTLPAHQAHDEMVAELRQRDKTEIYKQFVESAPDSLKAYAINSTVTSQSIIRFRDVLSSNISTMLRVGA